MVNNKCMDVRWSVTLDLVVLAARSNITEQHTVSFDFVKDKTCFVEVTVSSFAWGKTGPRPLRVAAGLFPPKQLKINKFVPLSLKMKSVKVFQTSCGSF